MHQDVGSEQQLQLADTTFYTLSKRVLKLREVVEKILRQAPITTAVIDKTVRIGDRLSARICETVECSLGTRMNTLSTVHVPTLTNFVVATVFRNLVK